jgi:hypothetical protein
MSNAALQVQLPQFDSPVEALGKTLTLRNLMQTGQVQQLQMQQQQQAMADDTSYRQAIQANPTGGEGLLRDLAGSGNYKGYVAATKAALDARKAEADIGQTKATTQNTQLEALNRAFTLHRDQINTITDPASAATWVQSAYQDPVLGPLVAQTGPVEAALSRIPTDPAGFAQWKLQAGLNAEKYVQQTTPDANTVANNATSTANNNRTVAASIENNKRTVAATERGQDKTDLRVSAADLSPEQNAALFGPGGAVATGKLDPNRINSRTATLYANAFMANPNTDFSKISADIALSRNATFRQRAMTAQVLPEIMGNMVEAGKKIGFSDNRTIGKMQGWVKGEFNDPDMTEYMGQRNDALMTIAAVMRGNGMSDMAHKAETEVAAPTMNPAALDAWLRGQMKSLQPRINLNNRVINHDQTPADSSAHPSSSAPKAGVPPIESFFIKK